MMIRKGPFGFEMNLDQEVQRVQSLPAHLADARETVLTAMGVQVVAWAVADYREKSEGRSAGGVQWKPITEGAIQTRLAGRTPWQRDTQKLNALKEQEKPILEELRKKLPSNQTNLNARNRRRMRSIDKANKAGANLSKKLGASGRFKQKARSKAAAARSRAAIAAKFAAEHEGWKRIRKERQKIKEKRKTTIAKELGKAKIGIDTGRLINSLVYGVPALSSVRVANRPTSTEGLTQGVFMFEGDSLRVGSIMKYAGYFDEKRPIFPPTFIDQSRQADLDKLGEKAVEAFIKSKERGR